jgi:hypothetical protein
MRSIACRTKATRPSTRRFAAAQDEERVYHVLTLSLSKGDSRRFAAAQDEERVYHVLTLSLSKGDSRRFAEAPSFDTRLCGGSG